MANLVTPPVPLRPIQERIIDFKGLNRKSVIEEGEMSDMKNLASDRYPLLAPRKPRAVMDISPDVKRPFYIVKRYSRLGYLAIEDNDDDTVGFYYDGQKVDFAPGLPALTPESSAVAINTKLCFFPQKIYVEIIQEGQQVRIKNTGSLEASVDLTEADVTVSANDVQVQLSQGHGLKADDAVNIEGRLSYEIQGVSHTMDVNVSCIIENVTEDHKIILPQGTFIELDTTATNISFASGTMKRDVPDLEHIVEWNNRLWGVSNLDNTVHACKLGDPTNWSYFQGTAMDSFYAQQGTDEAWTGVGEYSNHIIFFKPNSMCRIYGTSPATYQITNTKCCGVENGSSRSVVTINDRVFYKSSIGIMAYDGGTPYCISEKFNRRFKNVVAGTEGIKYYASCITKEGSAYQGHLLVLDIEKAIWHKEDSLRFMSAVSMDNKMYYTTSTSDLLYCDEDLFCSGELMVGSEDVEGYLGIINPEVPTENPDDIEWMGIFGPFDEYIEEHKIYSKLAFRVKANGPCSLKVYMALDEGPWELVEDRPNVSTQGDFIPIIPRRCDRYSVKVEGKGNFEIKSLTRRVRRGSFGRL